MATSTHRIFAQAPAPNPNSALIQGLVCVRVEDVEVRLIELVRTRHLPSRCARVEEHAALAFVGVQARMLALTG